MYILFIICHYLILKRRRNIEIKDKGKEVNGTSGFEGNRVWEIQTAWIFLHTSEPKWANTKRELRGSVLRSNVRATGSPSGRKGVPGEIFISPVSQRGNGINLG